MDAAGHRRIQEEVEKRSKVEKQLNAARDELQKFKNAKEAVSAGTCLAACLQALLKSISNALC